MLGMQRRTSDPRAPWASLSWASSLVLLGCSRPATPAGWIELEQVRPRLRAGVFLNEPLTLHFSGAVDQASVTRESLRIRDLERGSLARGRFEVQDGTVRFLPDLPTSPGLGDAGFQPGSRYEVEVLGFPALDGVRAVDGRPLAATYRWSFETAAQEIDGTRAQLFDDRTPLWGAPLRPRSLAIQVGRALLLECEEPLDPRTLPAAGFRLRPEGTGTWIPLDARLITNVDAGERPTLDRTLLELIPRTPLEPRSYILTQERGGLRDFGGNPVLVHGERGHELRIEVTPAGPSALHVESFLDTEGRSPVAVPGVDGTACWSGDGLVRVRMPAAAGDGRAGRLELEGEIAERDLQAVSLEVPAGRVAALTGAGPVILRAQGSWIVDGRLRRSSSGPSMLGELAVGPGETLTAWLGRLQGLDAAWTVLIAGGDLVVRGELDVEGPLLLVAGGLIRVPASSRVRSGVGHVRLVGEGGGPGLPSTAGRLTLELDEVRANTLREALVFAVLSGPIPVAGGVTRWLDSRVTAEPRDGRLEVLFVPDTAPLDEPLEAWGAHAHVAALGSATRLRILVRLEVGPPPEPDPRSVQGRDAPWNPPVVDDVILTFERAASR